MGGQEFCLSCCLYPTLGQHNCNITVKLYVKFNDNLGFFLVGIYLFAALSPSFSSTVISITIFAAKNSSQPSSSSQVVVPMNFRVKEPLTNTTREQEEASTYPARVSLPFCIWLLLSALFFLYYTISTFMWIVERSIRVEMNGIYYYSVGWLIPSPHIRLLTPTAATMEHQPRICGYFLALAQRFRCVAHSRIETSSRINKSKWR